MKPLLSREDYLSEAVLERERIRIFHSEWQFATVSTLLARHHDYVLINVAGKEVIVQNFSGTLSAFTNVCSHRYSAIHSAPRGNRPLQCPYHRWAYDRDGLPRGIPDRADFQELRSEGSLESLRLERWSVQLCGKLVFIRLSRTGQDLRKFLGERFARLEHLSNAFDREIYCGSMIYEANWKVVVQNTLEAYHVASVHPTTFGRLVRSRLVQLGSTAPHIEYRSAPFESPRPISPAREKIGSAMLATFAKSRLHAHEDSEVVISELLLLWPATTLGHTNGKAFALLHYTPIDAQRSELRVSQWYPTLHDADPDDEKRRDQAQPIITRFLTQVAEEDRVACEAVQRGIRSASTLAHGVLADQESMVHQFQVTYRQLMTDG